MPGFLRQCAFPCAYRTYAHSPGGWSNVVVDRRDPIYRVLLAKPGHLKAAVSEAYICHNDDEDLEEEDEFEPDDLDGE